MTPKLWQEKPKLSYSKDVVDIVQFGSSVKEGAAPKDMDIAVIYTKLPLKEQLRQSQQLKMQLEKLTALPIDIESYDWHSFFNEGNFAKEGILFYGKSLISGKPFASRFGCEPKTQIQYSLEKLPKKDKVRLHYQLQGKGGKYGLLRQFGGKLLCPGLIEVEPEFEEVFKSIVKEFTNELQVGKMLKMVE